LLAVLPRLGALLTKLVLLPALILLALPRPVPLVALLLTVLITAALAVRVVPLLLVLTTLLALTGLLLSLTALSILTLLLVALLVSHPSLQCVVLLYRPDEVPGRMSSNLQRICLSP
jgi:hypothetical protein